MDIAILTRLGRNMEDKEIESALAKIRENVASVAKTDFIMFFQKIHDLEKRIEKLEKKGNQYIFFSINFIIEFALIIILLIFLYKIINK